MILDEIKQSNGIKPPPKINFFMTFCKFLPQKGNFCWNMPSKISYTFYMKHQKYPFCAPIFHPLSETESHTKMPECIFWVVISTDTKNCKKRKKSNLCSKDTTYKIPVHNEVPDNFKPHGHHVRINK